MPSAVTSNQYSSARRFLGWLLLIGLLLNAIVLRFFIPVASTVNKYIIGETAAAVLAGVVGAIALVRFYSKKKNTLLFIGVGYLGAAVLDAYNALLVSHTVERLTLYSPQAILIWSWLSSRVFLSLLILMSWWTWRQGRRWGKQGQVRPIVVYAVATILLLATFLFFAFVPIPNMMVATVPLYRLAEVIPIIFFIGALTAYLDKRKWHSSITEYWLILSLTIHVVSELVLVLLSRESFDAWFSLAHLLKIVGYATMLIGLLMSMYHLFRQAAQAKNLLVEKNEHLKKETQSIQHAKAKDDAILQSIGEALVATNEEGVVIRVNKVCQYLLGRLDGEMIGKPVTMVIPMVDAAGHPIPWEKRTHPIALFGSKKTERSTDYYYVRKDNSRFPVAVTVTPIVLQDTSVGAIEVFRDITHEKEIDRAKTEFVSLASHQLRTPLTVINWYVEMLLDGEAGALTSEQLEYLQQVHDSSQRMAQLVGMLLNISRIELGAFAVEPAETDVGQLLDHIMQEFQLMIKNKRTQVQVVVEPQLPKLSLDPNLLTIVFQNLISNAIKYTPEGGAVHVDIRQQQRHWLITVADNGYGIPQHQQVQIFSKLFRADNAKEKVVDGTGLGLYMVKAIVEKTGGQIGFASEEGSGTIFTIQFPLSGMLQRPGSRTLDVIKV